MFVNTQKNDWDDYVDSILYAYRTSICTSTGYTPFELVFGRKANMPPDLLYDIEGAQLDKERDRGISVSKSMREAYRFVRIRQQQVSAANAKARDARRKDISFQVGDLVIQFDPSADKQGPHKFQFRFGQPLTVVRACPHNKNLYYVRNSKTGKVFMANVNRLLPVSHDNGDLGTPLGWRKPATTGFEHNDQYDGEAPETRKEGVIFEGDMVAVKVASESVEQLPFSVGKVLCVRPEGRLLLHWYGTTNNNMLATWKPGYVQASANKRYYRNSRLHPSHPPYTSDDTDTELTVADVLGTPFQLDPNFRLPVAVLRAAAEDSDVEFCLPAELRDPGHAAAVWAAAVTRLV